MSKESKEPGQTITLPDGRQLGHLVVGEGKPVFLFHGFPGSRLEALFFKEMASSKHLQIIGVDRPGFGLSTYAPRKAFGDFAADVSFLADHLRIERFALAGWSGGGHYAITCAALLAQRVTRAVVISGTSLPPDASEMIPMFRIAYRLATMPFIGAWIIQIDRNTFLKMAKDLDAYLNSKAGRGYLKSLSQDDAKFHTSPSESRDLLMRVYADSCRQSDGIGAAVDEIRLMKKGWGMDLSKIPAGLIHVWHGTADTKARVSNANRITKAIPGAQLKIFENEGHLFILNHLEELGDLLSS